MKQWNRANYLPMLPLGKDGRRATASKEHILISKNAAKEGMVLLKNRHRTLPLQAGTRVALFGKGTIDYVKGGGGSGDVTVPYVRNLYEGFCVATDASCIFPDTISFYREQVEKQYAMGRVPGMVAEPELPPELLTKAAAFADTAIISYSRFSGENWDRLADFDPIETHRGADTRPISLSREIFEKGDFYLSNAERELLRQVTGAFERVIVVLNTGGMMETAVFAEHPGVDAVLLAWQGGMEGGLAAAELLLGMGTPSGKLCDTFARDLRDYPFAERFFDSDDYVDYTEDIYVGYRYFETVPGAAEKVVYPFGYGLSYTEFSLTQPTVSLTDTEVVASVRVCNVGALPGREVVQLYYSAPQGKLGKPARELGGYRKTRLLAPGEEEVVIIRFPISDMASYDDLGKVQKSAWLLEAGEYRFHLGTSVRDTVESDTTLTLEETIITSQLESRMAPTGLKERMLADGTLEPLPIGPSNDPYANGMEPLDLTDPHTMPPVRGYTNRRMGIHTPQLSDVAEGKMTLDAFIAQLPDEDIAWLMGGQPNTGMANTFGVGNNPVYGIPNIMTADGPAGLRIQPQVGVTTTAFPCATLLCCSWDPAVLEQVGVTGAIEVKENNIGVWLTPGVCIHRNPLCGRNFEYFSEDPLLTGKQAAALIRGIQSQRVAATPKHFALNNKESNRRDCDSRASERAIREIYLRQFQILIEESHPWSIMSSYNVINGHRASENHDLLVGILREEWGFDGMVTTDWWTFGEHYKEAMAGNDLKMATGHPARLLQAKEMGLLTREAMEEAARHILLMILRVD
ncbi:MAG: beta-glucosidase [Clostridiales bacterium]|nr:beta-glucosidase [Clostridiales bacterium]